MKEMGKSRSLTEGSLTVEAGFVMGVVLTLLTAVLLLAFYLHDRATFHETVSEYAEGLRRMMEEPVDLYGALIPERLNTENIFRTGWHLDSASAAKAEREIQETADRYMFLCRVRSVSVLAEGGMVRVSYSGVFDPPFSGDLLRLIGVETVFSGEAEHRWNLEPEEFVRLCRGLIWRKKE